MLAAVLVLTGPPTPEAGAQSLITVQFDRGDYQAAEGGSARPKLMFSQATSSAATFTIIPINRTAKGIGVGGTDFDDRLMDVTVPANSTSHTFDFPILADDDIEDYETLELQLGSAPSGFTVGARGRVSVQIVNVSVVPDNWSLKPSGVQPGEQFRLLFKTHNERDATSSAISTYDTFVRDRISGSSTGHAAIRQYAPTFRAVGSTPSVHAAWHTATGIMVGGEPSHTPFSHRIYWLNGPKIADDYNDFWDGTWDDNSPAAHRRANGNASTNTRGPNTGTRTGTTHATAGTRKPSRALGNSSNQTRWGGGVQNQNPIDQGDIPQSNNNVYIGLSGIFEVDPGDAANPTISIAATQEKVTEGDTIRFTVRSVPPPATQKSISVTVDETTDGGRNFIPASQRGDRTVTVPANTGTVTFTVRTNNNDLAERDGGVTVTVNDGAGYEPHDTQNTASTVIESDEEFTELSASAGLGNGSAGPAHPGAKVVFRFDTGEAQAREIDGIRTQLAWGGDVLSPRSDHRPTTWDRYKVNPDWAPGAKVSRHGVYVRPWLERTIYRNDTGFDTDIYVKSRQEAGGAVGDGWIAMASIASSTTAPHPDAEWACMPVGNGTCPSSWPGVPVVSVVALDGGSVMSGRDARFRVSVSPAPGVGESRRVYLKTWEVFIEGKDEPCARFGPFAISPGRPNSKWHDWDPYRHCKPRLRNKDRKVQRTAYSHVDVGSGGSATVVVPTELFRHDPVNITGRNYWVEVQDDVAYGVGGGSRAEVVTTAFDPASAECWFGHTHYPASSPYAVRIGPIDAEGLKQLARHGTFGNTGSYRYKDGSNVPLSAGDTHPYDVLNADFNGDGMVDQADVDMLGRDKLRGFGYLLEVTRHAASGFTGCLTADEIDGRGGGSYRTVWTTCRVDYGHTDHSHSRYSDGRGGAHSHHSSYSATRKFGDGNCAHGSYSSSSSSSQLEGQADADAEAAVEAVFPDPGVLTFSGVTETAMTLSWPQRDVDRYLVYWAEAAGGGDTHTVEVDADTHSYTLSGLEPGTVYAAIVYSDGHDEVTTTGYQTTLAAAHSDPAPCDPTAAIDKATAALRWHLSHGSDAALFWRILNTLDAADLPAKPSGVTEETVSAQYVKDFSSGKGWAGWTPIVEAMEQCTADPDPATPDPDPVTPDPDPVTPDPVPEVSVAAGAGVSEGGDAVFTVTASPAPSAPLTVAVSVAQAGDFGVAAGPRTVTIPISGSATLTVATTDDSTDEADGSVTATVGTASGYTVSATAGVATVAVADDDDPPPVIPEVSITAGSGITEGDDAAFTLTAAPAPSVPLTVTVSVAQAGDFGAVPGPRTVTIPISGSATLTVATINDSTDEADGSVTATVDSGGGYTVSATADAATTTVADDDDPPPPPSDPGFAVHDATGAEGESLRFRVTLNSAPRSTQVSAYWMTFNGDGSLAATPGVDYSTARGWLDFGPGDTELWAEIPLLEDDRQEPQEQFVVKLIWATPGLTVADGQATMTITDND